MITVKCTNTNGDSIIMRFNGTLKDAETYFLNRIFNVGTVHDDMQKGYLNPKLEAQLLSITRSFIEGK